MSAFVTAAELRSYLDIASIAGRASDTNLGLLIEASSDFLERATGRIITSSASNTSRTFSTDGRAAMSIPDLRVASSITLQSTALTADSTYYLIAARSTQQPANEIIYTGIQFQAYGAYDHRSNPEWYDRNLDSPRWSMRRYGLPNDLVISGLWGWTTVPAQWKLATLVLAGYEYKRPDSLLANVAITPEGTALDYGQMPPEVRELIDGWRLGETAVTV